jgi:hypothetical protein
MACEILILTCHPDGIPDRRVTVIFYRHGIPMGFSTVICYRHVIPYGILLASPGMVLCIVPSLNGGGVKQRN